jgi:hypothetical protein
MNNIADNQVVKSGSRSWGIVLIVLGLTGLIIFSSINIRHTKNTRLEQQQAQEADLEKMHSLGFDQGYVEAVIDTYLGDPLYMLTEEHGGQIKLWKKTPLDPVYSKKVHERINP